MQAYEYKIDCILDSLDLSKVGVQLTRFQLPIQPNSFSGVNVSKEINSGGLGLTGVAAGACVDLMCVRDVTARAPKALSKCRMPRL